MDRTRGIRRAASELVNVARLQTIDPSPITDHRPSTILSCPGETSEVHETLREVLTFVRERALVHRCSDSSAAAASNTTHSTGHTGHLGIKAYFRGGRPLAEQPDARLLLLLLETIRSEFSRAAVMELACHVGPYSHWDALSCNSASSPANSSGSTVSKR